MRELWQLHGGCRTAAEAKLFARYGVHSDPGVQPHAIRSTFPSPCAFACLDASSSLNFFVYSLKYAAAHDSRLMFVVCRRFAGQGDRQVALPLLPARTLRPPYNTVIEPSAGAGVHEPT